jgi:hypothetical protein
MPTKRSLSLEKKGEPETEEILDAKLNTLLSAMSRMSHTQQKLSQTLNLLRRSNNRIETRVNKPLAENSNEKPAAAANDPSS